MESPNKVSVTSVCLAAVLQRASECTIARISAHLEDYRLSFDYKKKLFEGIFFTDGNSTLK